MSKKENEDPIVKEICPWGCMMVIEGPAEFVEETMQAHYEAMHQFDPEEPLPWERYEDDFQESDSE